MKHLPLFFFLFIPFLIKAQVSDGADPYFGRYYHSHFVVIADSNYFNRMDEIKKQHFKQELDYLDIAYEYLEKGDFESTEYWARKVASFEELYVDRYYLLVMASANMKDKSKFRMYYKKFKQYAPPEEIRQTSQHLIDLNMIRKAE
ncbi:MAG: hypothetical protein ACOC0C_02515 [Bacteroidota bacterium]